MVTTAATAPDPRPYPVHWVDRKAPKGRLHARVVRLVAARARHVDVVYATSMSTRSSIGAVLARRPLVVKAAGDVAYERSRRLGFYDGDLVGFQSAGGLVLDVMRAARTAALGRAKTVVVPSEFLRGLALGWGIDAERLAVVPNPTPFAPPLDDRPALRERLGIEGPTIAFAGRLTAAKSLGVALSAVGLLPGATLLVVGDGEERAQLERAAGERVRFLGAQPHDEVLRLFRAADVVVLSSRWENFPHVLVEALAVGTPVVASAVGGVPEIVEDGVNGLLVAPEDPGALAAALRRVLEEPGLRDRLASAAQGSVDRFAPERVYGQLERILLAAAAD